MRVKELSGYAPRIVTENVELLQFINEQIQRLDKDPANPSDFDDRPSGLMAGSRG
jgi:hypothetical protein